MEAYAIDPEAKFDSETAHLLFPGSGLGGVRPKTVVIHDGTEHIAKFSRPDDLFDVPAAEYAALRLGTRAGINIPSFELIKIRDRSVLLVERFDRVGDRRIHYASAHSFLDPRPLSHDGREYVTNFSYAGIAEILRPYGLDARADAHELYRRMILNIMVGNVDDHLRNHAFLMLQPGQYRLSPAFDIVPHLEAPGRPQSIGVGELGPASTIANALSQCGRFLLTKEEAHTIIDEVKAIASTWRDEFREAGVAPRDIHALAGCFHVADEADRLQVPVQIALPGDEGPQP
ncbi:type II toxin-antitoxin system HipA family toxin [Pseudoduganella sp. R-31]|uniref:type II toxin-antitoxin system HipA family toxin n=1 Tax=unclassified Pseudoduganella TaxID=2637179 RepID=UPI003CECAD00